MIAVAGSSPEQYVPESVGCCQWFRKEFSSAVPWFHDGPDPNGKTIDLDRSFCIGEYSSWGLVLLKLALFGLEVATLVVGWTSYTHPHWFMSYVSHLTVLYSCVYVGLSLLSAFFRETPLWLVKATWVMYSVAAVQGIMVILLFWLTEYGPEFTLTYFLIMAHGVTCMVVIFDGFVINRIPVRLKHCVFVVLFGALFVGWTIVQSLVPVDNPWKDGDESNALYKILDWDDSPLQAAIVGAGVVFVTFPLWTMVLWGLSLSGRRYLPDEKASQDHFAQEDIEMQMASPY